MPRCPVSCRLCGRCVRAWRTAVVLCARARAARGSVAAGQQSVDFASVSGRVTDPQGAVVPGAQVSARQTETNVAAETVTDCGGRFRFPYLKVGPYELKVHMRGIRRQHPHADADGRLGLRPSR